MQKDTNILTSLNADENALNGTDKVSRFGNKWSGWATIIATIIALIALLGGGTFFYNEIWQSKKLVYSILPTYDIGNQAFSGIVIENRGRVPLRNVEIIVAHLEAPITALNMPGAHEPVNLKSGGVGSNELFLEMPRLSSGGVLPIYILTSGVVKLDENQTFFISSDETKGVLSSNSNGQDTSPLIAIGFGLLGILVALPVNAVFTYYLRRDEQIYQHKLDTIAKQRELLLQHKLEIAAAERKKGNASAESKEGT